MNKVRITIPNTYIKVSTGELVHYSEVTDNPQINLFLADTQDGVTIDDIIGGTVPNVHTESPRVRFVPKTEPGKMIEKAIKQGLIPDNPEIVIDATGIKSVGGIDWDELQRRLDAIPVTPPLDISGIMGMLGAILGRMPTTQEMNDILEMMRTQTRTQTQIRDLVETMEKRTSDRIDRISIAFPGAIDRFPFSLPWDFARIFVYLNVSPREPIFHYDFKIQNEFLGIDINRTIIIDPTIFRVGGLDVVRLLINSASWILFLLALIKATAKLLVAEKVI
jgi:hypothetical protein